jgi:serine/threonine protein kinase
MMINDDGHSWTSPEIRGQFLKEARVGGRLLHPNILSVFDLGVNRSGQIYYTMRIVDGVSLQVCLESLAQGVITKFVSFPLRKMVSSLVGACQGVDYAHQNGVIHLDLKPHNILVSGFHEVFVIDWGLARVDDIDDTERLVDLYRNSDDSGTTASHTAAVGGRVVGTPGYMAPEQFRGDYRSFDPTTDVYGLGGVLYYILFGKAPNHWIRPADMHQIMNNPRPKGRLREGILPRGQRVRKEVQQAIDALEAISLKALEPEQKNRYSDVEQMLIDLNEWLAVTPGPPQGI